jgi:hypothetical protein
LLLGELMPIEIEEGMLVQGGRIVSVCEIEATVWDNGKKATKDIPLQELELMVSDRVTQLLLLEQLALRTGLDPSQGLLWYLGDTADQEEPVWVLEDTEEVRHRPGDTTDAAEALKRAMMETEVEE